MGIAFEAPLALLLLIPALALTVALHTGAQQARPVGDRVPEPPDPQEGLLHGVLGVLRVAQHQARGAVGLRVVLLQPLVQVVHGNRTQAATIRFAY